MHWPGIIAAVIMGVPPILIALDLRIAALVFIGVPTAFMGLAGLTIMVSGIVEWIREIRGRRKGPWCASSARAKREGMTGHQTSAVVATVVTLVGVPFMGMTDGGAYSALFWTLGMGAVTANEWRKAGYREGYEDGKERQ